MPRCLVTYIIETCAKGWRRSAKQSGPLVFLFCDLFFSSLSCLLFPARPLARASFFPDDWLVSQRPACRVIAVVCQFLLSRLNSVQLWSVFTIPTEFSTSVVCSFTVRPDCTAVAATVCFYCPDSWIQYSCALFLLSRLNSVQPTLKFSTADSEFSIAAVVCFYCPDGIPTLYSFVFRRLRLSRLNLHWWLSHRYTIRSWSLTDSVLPSGHSGQYFFKFSGTEKCLSHRDAAEIGLGTFPIQVLWKSAVEDPRNIPQNNKK